MSPIADLEQWRARADGGDSQYAIALGLMAIADAVVAHATKELEAVARLMEHDRLRALAQQQRDDAERDELPRRWWNR